jgi:FMN phosphatase YigB (HAD superfamily)
MSRFPLFIFDLDNTVYDWYSAFLPAFYEMVRVASGLLDCDQEQLLTELKQIHIKHHDVEHPFSLVETSTVQKLIEVRGRDAVWKLLDPAFHAFNKLRKENLKMFPGSLETLVELRSRGIELVAYTDSTYFAAYGRVERLGLSDLFTRVYCRERGRSRLPERVARSDQHNAQDKVVEIPSHESKPNPRVLLDIVTKQNFVMSQVAYVGDSLSKDVLMAKRANCFAVWAKYGAHTDREMYERLIRISHWTVEDIQREKNYAVEAENITPDFVCERSMAELVQLT